MAKDVDFGSYSFEDLKHETRTYPRVSVTMNCFQHNRRIATVCESGEFEGSLQDSQLSMDLLVKRYSLNISSTCKLLPADSFSGY